VDKPFTDDDEALLVNAAKRIGPALDLQRVLEHAADDEGHR
jgi:hypothetical protein